MTDDEIRRTLLWVIERTDLQMDEREREVFQRIHSSILDPCATCGHGRSAHVVDGDADDPTPWPCMYPVILGFPVPLCRCEDFQPIGVEE